MEEDNEQEKHTVPISMGDNKCAVCLEKFDSFFHQDDEVKFELVEEKKISIFQILFVSNVEYDSAC